MLGGGARQGGSGHVRLGVPYEWRNYGPGSSQQKLSAALGEIF